jgi:hypothetical protein
MRQMNVILILGLIYLPTLSVAGDKKEQRSLATDAAYLAEKGGKITWFSTKISVSVDDGKKKTTGKLLMVFSPSKDKPTGTLIWGVIVHDKSGADESGVSVTCKFDLVEKDGKRYIKIIDMSGEEVVEKDKKVLIKKEKVLTLEYVIKSDELIIKGGVGGVVRLAFPGWYVDLTDPITFRAGGK